MLKTETKKGCKSTTTNKYFKDNCLVEVIYTLGRGMMKKSLMIIGALIFIGILILSENVNLNRMDAVYNILNEFPKKDVEVLEIVNLLEGRELIVYRNMNKSEYGHVLLRKAWGIFYHAEGAVKLQLSSNQPLARSKPSMYGKEMILVATNNSEIAYISSGIEDLNFSQETIQSLTLKDVLAKPDNYRVQEVKDGYTLFIWDESITSEESDKNNYMLAFDKEGHLIVDATGTLHGIYVK